MLTFPPCLPIERTHTHSSVAVHCQMYGKRDKGPQRSGVGPPLSSSRACLHTAFIAVSVLGGGGGDLDRGAAGLWGVGSRDFVAWMVVAWVRLRL